MIPKIIHYCWFGKNPLDKKAKRCIETWKKFFPDYEIKEWNEETFDVSMLRYTKEAYEAKKWAFVSDVARLYALYTCGGIYFDTDVEVIKPFDDLLDGKTVLGLEENGMAATCVMIAPKSDALIKTFLDTYQNEIFIKEDGTYNYIPNTKRLSDELMKIGFSLQKGETIGDIRCLDIACFSPYDSKGNPKNLTKDTYSIHHFAATWLPEYKLRDRKKEKSRFTQIRMKSKDFFQKIKGKYIRILSKFNPLYGEILSEKGLDSKQSYKLSKRFDGRIFVYKNTNVYISPTAVIDVKGTLRIGLSWERFEPETTNFIIGDSATLLVKGNFRIYSGSRVAVNTGATLVLGKDGFMNMHTNIRCFDKIVISDNAKISEEVIISDSDNHTIKRDGYKQAAPIEIGNHVLIGLRSVLLKGVSVGEGAIIAAGSVVTKDIPPRSLAGGVPAKVIKENIDWE